MKTAPRIVEWSQAVYADMPQKCWTILDADGHDLVGTFWSKAEAEDCLRSMTRPFDALARRMEERERDEEALRNADMTVRHTEGF